MVRSKFAIATHIMTFLAHRPNEWTSSSHIARSVNINPVLVRNELALLKTAGWIESKEGRNGGVRLLIPASEIRLSDIFTLVKGEDNVLGFSKNEGNPNCPIGSNMRKNLSKLYFEMDDIIEATLSKLTLEEFASRF